MRGVLGKIVNFKLQGKVRKRKLLGTNYRSCTAGWFLIRTVLLRKGRAEESDNVTFIKCNGHKNWLLQIQLFTLIADVQLLDLVLRLVLRAEGRDLLLITSAYPQRNDCSRLLP